MNHTGIKEKLKCMRGCHAEQLPSYLDEFMWRERHGRSAGIAFLQLSILSNITVVLPGYQLILELDLSYFEPSHLCLFRICACAARLRILRARGMYGTKALGREAAGGLSAMHPKCA